MKEKLDKSPYTKIIFDLAKDENKFAELMDTAKQMKEQNEEMLPPIATVILNICVRLKKHKEAKENF